MDKHRTYTWSVLRDKNRYAWPLLLGGAVGSSYLILFSDADLLRVFLVVVVLASGGLSVSCDQLHQRIRRLERQLDDSMTHERS